MFLNEYEIMQMLDIQKNEKGDIKKENEIFS